MLIIKDSRASSCENCIWRDQASATSGFWLFLLFCKCKRILFETISLRQLKQLLPFAIWILAYVNLPRPGKFWFCNWAIIDSFSTKMLFVAVIQARNIFIFSKNIRTIHWSAQTRIAVFTSRAFIIEAPRSLSPRSSCRRLWSCSSRQFCFACGSAPPDRTFLPAYIRVGGIAPWRLVFFIVISAIILSPIPAWRKHIFFMWRWGTPFLTCSTTLCPRNLTTRTCLFFEYNLEIYGRSSTDIQLPDSSKRMSRK